MGTCATLPCPNSHWTQEDVVEKVGRIHYKACGIFELPSHKPCGTHVQLHLQLLYPWHTWHDRRAPNFWVPVSGISALQVTWGCTNTNWYSRGPGQKLRLSERTAARWGRIISNGSEQCTRGANHFNSPHPRCSTLWTALQTPGIHPTAS